jgi:hypothetical protein
MDENDVKYRARVLSHALAESKENGTPSVKIHFELLYNLDSPEVETHKSIYHDLWLSEKAFNRSMDVLVDVLGWKGSNLSELNDSPDLLADSECVLVTNLEEYNGKTRIKVKFVNSIQKKLDSSKAKTLSEKLASKVAIYKSRKPESREPGVDFDEPMPDDGGPGF